MTVTDPVHEWRQAAYKATRERDEARAERDRYCLAWHNARDRASDAKELTAHYVELVDVAQRQVGDLAEAIRQRWSTSELLAFMAGERAAPLREVLPPFPYHLARCMSCDLLTDDCTCTPGTEDACRIVEVDGGPVRVHGGEMDATSTAYLGEVVAAAKRLMATLPPGPLEFDCPQCGAVPGQLCRRESGMGGRAPHQERRALAPLRTPATPEVEPLPSTATGAPAYVAGPATTSRTIADNPLTSTNAADNRGEER